MVTDDDDDDFYLGAEAALPAGMHGTTIPSTMPDPEQERRTLREMERRFRLSLSPAFPVFEKKRQLPGAVILASYRQFALRSRSLYVDAFGRDQRYLDKVGPLLKFFGLTLTGADIEGPPLARGAGILVCEDSVWPAVDSVLVSLLSDEIRPLVPDPWMQRPFVGVMLRKLGAVRACRANARALLHQGHTIAVFKGRDGGNLWSEDRIGLQDMAEELGAQVRRARITYKLGRWRLRYGEALDIAGANPEDTSA